MTISTTSATFQGAPVSRPSAFPVQSLLLSGLLVLVPALVFLNRGIVWPLMYGDKLLADVGAGMNGTIGTVPWAEGEGADAFVKLSAEAGNNSESSYTRESYDAAALLLLAMQKGGAATSEAAKANIMDIANAPGEKILPGELGKALEILKNGGDIDYVGATNVELIGPGEASGTYREYEVRDGKYETVKIR